MVITESGSPIDEAALSAFERALGVRLPDAYRQFLFRHNGGVPRDEQSRALLYAAPDDAPDDETDVRQFFGLRDRYYEDLRYHAKTFADRIRPGTVAIASDSAGNLFLIAAAGPDAGAVYFWNHDTEAATPLAADFPTFLSKLRPMRG